MSTEVELTNEDFARFEAVAFRCLKRLGLADRDAQGEATSFAYAAAEVLRERLEEAAFRRAR